MGKPRPTWKQKKSERAGRRGGIFHSPIPFWTERTDAERAMIARECCTECWHERAGVFMTIQHDDTREMRETNLCSGCLDKWQIPEGWDIMGSR